MTLLRQFPYPYGWRYFSTKEFEMVLQAHKSWVSVPLRVEVLLNVAQPYNSELLLRSFRTLAGGGTSQRRSDILMEPLYDVFPYPCGWRYFSTTLKADGGELRGSGFRTLTGGGTSQLVIAELYDKDGEFPYPYGWRYFSTCSSKYNT